MAGASISFSLEIYFLQPRMFLHRVIFFFLFLVLPPVCFSAVSGKACREKIHSREAWGRFFHEQPARRAALRDRPEKQLFLPQEMRMTDSFCLLSVLWEFKIPCSFSVFGMFGEIFKDVEWERQYVILRKVRKWDWKQEACPGFHAVYTAVLIFGRITGRWQEGWLSEKLRTRCPFRNTESFKSWKTLFRSASRYLPETKL